jgi:PAS domain S-box-containing protein
MFTHHTSKANQATGGGCLSVQNWVMQNPSTYLQANLEHCEFLGVNAETLLSKGMACIVDEDIMATLQSLHEEAFLSSQKMFREVQFSYTSQALAVTVTPLPDEILPGAMLFTAHSVPFVANKPPQPMPIGEDILRASMHGMGAGLWHWNVQTGETLFDDKWAEMLGYTIEELSPTSIRTWEMLTHPQDLEQAGQLLDDHFKGKKSQYDARVRMKHKHGHWVWIHDRGRVYEWSIDGQPLRMAGSHVDISERQNLATLVQKQSKLQGIASTFAVELLKSPIEELDLVVEAGLGEIGRFLDTDRVYIFQLNTLELTMSNTHEWVATGVSPEKENLLNLPYSAFPWWMDQIQLNETIYIPDTSELPDEQKDLKEILEMQSIKSLLVVPIEGREGIMGFIGMDFVTDHWAFDKFTHQVIKYISSLISGSLESKMDQMRIIDLLAQERKVFQRIADETLSIIMTTNLKHEISYVNKAFTEIYEYSQDEVHRKLPEILLRAKDLGWPEPASVKSKLQTEKRWKGMLVNLTKGGRVVFESATITPRYDAKGEVTGFIKISEIITETQKNYNWMKIFSRVPELSLTIQRDPTLLSDGLATLLSQDRTLLIPHSFLVIPRQSTNTSFLSPLFCPVADSSRDPNKTLKDERLTEKEYQEYIKAGPIHNLRSGNGHPLQHQPYFHKLIGEEPGEMLVAPIRTKFNSYGIIVGLHSKPVRYFDETDASNLNSLGKLIGQVLDELTLNEFIYTQNTQEQISRLASGLAHEVRNPLAVISMGMEVLESEMDRSNFNVQRVTDNINRSVSRANQIVENLMRLGTPQEMEADAILLRLDHLVNEAIGLVTYHLRSQKIRLSNHCDRPVEIRSVKESILKVLVNVLLNSIQALPIGGNIKISLHGRGTGRLHLEIEDNGPGIPAEDLHRVTKPFFSTKKDKQGTGMGLYICTQTMQRLGGSFNITNKIPHGVVVQIGMKELINEAE